MRRRILLLLIFVFSVIWLWNCSDGSGGASKCSNFVPQKLEGDYIKRFQQSTLNEINLVRQCPNDYITQRLGENLQSYSQCYRGDNGLTEDLKKHVAISTPLTLDDKINSASMKYAKFLHDNNKFGHFENGSPSDRCQAEGYPSCGENLASYGSTQGFTEKYWNAQIDAERSGKSFVLQLLIDCDYPGVGHRKNILKTSYKKLGSGYYQGLDPRGLLKHLHVQNFGTQ